MNIMMMKKLKCWKVMLLVAIHCLIYFDDRLVFFLSAADDPNRTLADERVAKGFISIDCGMMADSRYDNVTGLHYTSDDAFINTGINNIVGDLRGLLLYNTVRSFPEGKRNCYTLKPKQGKNNSYLIRAHFEYGNYDEKLRFPQFNLYIDVNFWAEVQQYSTWRQFSFELIYTPPGDDIHVCLVNIGKGVPFISGLELKPLNTTSIYKSSTGALLLIQRYDPGSTSTLDYYYNVKDDPYDRIWAVVPKSFAVWGSLPHDESMKTAITTDYYKLPPSVLTTAAIPENDTGSLDFYYKFSRTSRVAQVYWHFVEIQKLGINDSREFTISLNGQPLQGNISPKYMQASTIVSHATSIDAANNYSLVFNITRTPKSTLPPILNALEIYIVLQLPKSATNQDDVNAIMNIKNHYTVPKGWQGDPCRPAPTWNGLNCSQDDDNHSPRITSLNLAVRALVGDIPSSLSNLTSLTYLNLSYNRLTGAIPDFLANLSSLQILDLKSNKLTGRVPTALRKKAEEGTLDLRLEDNPSLCTSGSCNKRNWKKIRTILAATIVSITLIVTAIAAIYKYKQKKPANSRGNNVGFSMNNNVEEEYELPIYDLYVVAQATNHFSKSNKVGEGGFGPVYKGVLSDGQEIAVKRLSKDSRQGSDEFKNEVIFIAKLQHRNLVKLLGCCIEAEERLLIYEYMPNKSLDFYIFEPTSRKLLDWPTRLEIINGIARGLLYLHQDSRLRIVHRDLKASNILLDSEMNAKISDFGLARSFNGAQDAAMTKRLVGTYGYMPPEYAIDGLFSVKSDVFSFGVIILEIISGEKNRGFTRSDHHHTLLGHAWMLFKEGVALEVANHQIRNSKYASEMVRLIHIGLLCVQQHPKDRPNMSQVSVMLNSDSALPEPKEPGFYARRNFPQESEASNAQSSTNYDSITCLSGR